MFEGFRLTWAGECSAWECDELGHLNMRHYVAKFSEARKFFLIQLGLVNAFKPSAHSSVQVKDLHIKYQGEARPGQPLKVMSAVTELSSQSARICHIMYHHDGRIAATQHETVEHIYLLNNLPFNWPKRLIHNVQHIITPAPAPSAPRNIDTKRPHKGLPRRAMERQGLAAIGAGVMQSSEMNAAGFASPEAMFGRSTSTIAWFTDGWPELNDAAYRDNNGSAAVLEIFANFHRFPREGDAYEYRAALLRADSYTRTIMHHICDAVTGQCLASLEANACLFDLNHRNLIKASSAQLAVLAPNIKSGLSP